MRLWKKILLLLLGLGLVLYLALLAILTAREYMPAEREELSVVHAGNAQPLVCDEEGLTIRLLSWNIGHAGGDAQADSFREGGWGVSADALTVHGNLAAIAAFLHACSPDFLFLQEVDYASARSGGVDERESFTWMQERAYAPDFVCPYVPYPLAAMGRVNSGLMTLASHPLLHADRVSLPACFRRPASAMEPKRCLLVSRTPVQDTDRELVLVNFRLESYDSGAAGRAAQTAALLSFLEREYRKGNYVVAGGDFSQLLPGTEDAYPQRASRRRTPPALSAALPEGGWRLAFDSATPTRRLLDRPYDAESEKTQFFCTDGFLLSPNVELERMRTLDTAFRWSAHNPVMLEMHLPPPSAERAPETD